MFVKQQINALVCGKIYKANILMKVQINLSITKYYQKPCIRCMILYYFENY